MSVLPLGLDERTLTRTAVLRCPERRAARRLDVCHAVSLTGTVRQSTWTWPRVHRDATCTRGRVPCDSANEHLASISSNWSHEATALPECVRLSADWTVFAEHCFTWWSKSL